MIGDQHVDAGGARGGHTGVARDAVVHGHDQRGRARARQRDDLGRQPVAELEAVRHQEIDRGEAPAAQRPHQQRGAGRAVGIEIADDHAREPARAMTARAAPPPPRCRPACRPAAAAAATALSSAGIAHAARGVDALQYRMDIDARDRRDCSGLGRRTICSISRQLLPPGRARRHTRVQWRHVSRCRRVTPINRCSAESRRVAQRRERRGQPAVAPELEQAASADRARQQRQQHYCARAARSSSAGRLSMQSRAAAGTTPRAAARAPARSCRADQARQRGCARLRRVRRSGIARRRRRRRVGSIGALCRAHNHSAVTGSCPRRLRSRLSGCSCSHSSISEPRRRSAAASGPLRHPRRDHRAEQRGRIGAARVSAGRRAAARAARSRSSRQGSRRTRARNRSASRCCSAPLESQQTRADADARCRGRRTDAPASQANSGVARIGGCGCRERCARRIAASASAARRGQALASQARQSRAAHGSARARASSSSRCSAGAAARRSCAASDARGASRRRDEESVRMSDQLGHRGVSYRSCASHSTPIHASIWCAATGGGAAADRRAVRHATAAS